MFWWVIATRQSGRIVYYCGNYGSRKFAPIYAGRKNVKKFSSRKQALEVFENLLKTTPDKLRSYLQIVEMDDIDLLVIDCVYAPYVMGITSTKKVT